MYVFRSPTAINNSMGFTATGKDIIMNFANALIQESKKTFTENGATAINTTGSAMLDLFSTIGALRTADDMRIQRLFADAYKEDPLLATKCLFYARDIRGGLGERATFRKLLNYTAKYHQEAIRKNVDLIPEYGRWDDLYALVGTALEEQMWKTVKLQLNADLIGMTAKTPVSLLAKWLKTPDASSKETRRLGRLTALRLGLDEKSYKRKLRALRKYIQVTEVDMSANRWDQIPYSNVPSRASMLYRDAFLRHDKLRYVEFLNAVNKGEAKINASTLYPYDIIEKYMTVNAWDFNNHNLKQDDTLEAQWKALPDYVGREANAMVIADTSGSMYGRPIASAIGLAIYFAERNKGAYHNLWMSFSSRSNVHALHGETLAQKLDSINTDDWGNNTNLKLAFENILDIAVEHHIPADEMIKSLIIVSDMEIDACVSKKWLFYDEMKDRFEEAGYKIPNVVFWNVDSRHDVFHVDATRKGVQLCSGQSASTFKQLMESIGMTPVEMMHNVLNSERYEKIQIEK